VLEGVQLIEVDPVRMQLGLAADLVILRQGRPHLPQAPCHCVIDAATEFLRDVLGQAGDAQAGQARHLAAIRGHPAGEQFQQRALARTIAAQQRNPLAGFDPKVDARDHRFAAIADTDVTKS
jgi:hypothetical protein